VRRAVLTSAAWSYSLGNLQRNLQTSHNSPLSDAYRGAGRPEATYVVERLIDRAAADIGMDAAELRSINLPEEGERTFSAPTGQIIDGGRFLDNQRRCLALADRAGFAGRRKVSAARGLLRGFGFANYLELNGGLAVAKMIEPTHAPVESAALVFSSDGSLRVTIGTQSTGQDHARPMVLYAAKELGIGADSIVVCEGDSAAVSIGGGTGGSKSLLTSSVAIEQAVADVVARGRALLAGTWNTMADNIVFENGIFSLPGSNRSTSVVELAAAHAAVLSGESHGTLQRGSCANGCHACELEVDPETGEVRVLRYVAVDDFGKVVQEAAVHGQVQEVSPRVSVRP
jgi:aerobic carbon-monoxide dehydrogenase large subunit